MIADFGRWFGDQGKAREVSAAPEVPDLPDGLWERNGKYMATCRACENDYEIGGTPDEFHSDVSYCGGSPRCIP